MKKLTLYWIAALFGLTAAVAQTPADCGVPVTNARLERNAGLMTAKMELALGDVELENNRVAVFTPAIVNGTDSLLLAPVGIYTRPRWYNYLRSGEGPVGGAAERSYRLGEQPATFDYNETVAYAEWMNGAELLLLRRDYGCCREQTGASQMLLADYRVVPYVPVYRYAQPKAEAEGGVKLRTLSGRAFIDFPVNQTVIYPDYRNNRVELVKIIATIDSVRNDADITVSSLSIKGFASPEGSYANNTRLAKGRTEALKQYVQNLYHFAAGFIATDYEPEDWEGLRAYVEQSNLQHRTEILAVIDDAQLDIDVKNSRIQVRYPDEYRFLLQTVYPSLRHSDYTIEYTIRHFTEPEEIGRLLDTEPQKLSLEEIMLYAQTLEPGSDRFEQVFETAVRMFPSDETANLNAAVAAMQRNDLKSAEFYLAKAGTSPEAVYARGVYAALTGDYAGAQELVRAANVPESRSVVEHLEEVKRHPAR